MVKVKCLINNLNRKGIKNKGDIFEVDEKDAERLSYYKLVSIVKDDVNKNENENINSKEENKELIPDNMKANISGKKTRKKKGGK